MTRKIKFQVSGEISNSFRPIGLGILRACNSKEINFNDWIYEESIDKSSRIIELFCSSTKQNDLVYFINLAEEEISDLDEIMNDDFFIEFEQNVFMAVIEDSIFCSSRIVLNSSGSILALSYSDWGTFGTLDSVSKIKIIKDLDFKIEDLKGK